MSRSSNKFAWGVAAVVIVIIAIFVASSWEPADGKYDAFASCLKDRGAVFYGAFWCPHCQNQKKMFGASARLLDYRECSTPDGRGQVPACADKGIESYPTWEFKDGSRELGEMSFAKLVEKTGCELPK